MMSPKPSYPIPPARRKISPLTLKILGVNIGALIMLAFGFLYTAQYENQLIESELNALNKQAQLIAAALSEGGVREKLDESPDLARDLSQLMIRKLSAKVDYRIILFDSSGDLIADSHRLSGAGGVVQIIELPPPAYMQSWHVHLQNNLSNLLGVLPTRLNLQQFPKTDIQSVQSFPDMIETLRGESFERAWHDENGDILLSATRPVARLKQVLGGLMLIRTGDRIEKAITAVQLNVIMIFLGTLAITICLSVYLSATIATPIQRLSRAADRMRLSQADLNLIPDLSGRRDEIGELSFSLRELTETLNARLIAIESFAADVAHELKNPLASVHSAAETLPKVKDNATRRRLEKIILDDIERINRLIGDISAASRLDAQLNRDKKHVFNLTALLKGVIDNYNARPDTPDHIKFLTSLLSDQVSVKGNDSRLAQVFSNILDNALSFAPENTPVTVRLVKEFDRLLIMIENKGPAIPDNKTETIFSRFYTERPESDDFGLHSGLGLSISRQIVKAHDGEIHAENLIDKNRGHLGVRFTVTLPIYDHG